MFLVVLYNSKPINISYFSKCKIKDIQDTHIESHTSSVNIYQSTKTKLIYPLCYFTNSKFNISTPIYR
uniref:Uncharacterized protein n=1 Tax=Myoviridae sp. ctdNl2 TaxID=2825140 RepID=A0A8S5QI73_9CAUD|nr:MAG TPA: hypothetical protein [Myoviridae sp. ctdNl2]DAK40728.1 MAG TPA: hypothetical protein [Caudoviricetes sp.]